MVYITQDTGKINLMPATRFGDLRVLTHRDCPIGKTEAFISKIAHELSNYDPNNDYLVLVGDPILIGICVAIIAGQWDRLTVLKWDRQELCYIPVTLVFGDYPLREENNNG